jgi:general secretion pathway protein G
MKPDRSRGFSLLELVVVIVIIALLMAFAVNKYLALAAEAERAAMENLAGTLRSALHMKMAELIVRNRMQDIPALAGSNPMDRLAEAPQNYLGERDGVHLAGIEGGSWYFDTGARTLVYRVQSAGYFQTALEGPARVRFAVRLVFQDQNKNGVFDAQADKIEGVKLVALEPYRWTN